MIVAYYGATASGQEVLDLAYDRAHGMRGCGYVVSDIENDEPIFVLRGRDALALPVLRLYQTMADGLFDEDKDASLNALARQFREWALKPTPGQLRFPD